MYADEYYKFSLRDTEAYRLPVFVPNNTMGLLMVYYSPSEGIDKYAKVCLKDNSTLSVKQNVIALYRNSIDGTISTGEYLTLEKGINIIRIKESGVLELRKQPQTDPDAVDLGTILTSEIRIVNLNEDGVSTPSGVNYKLLNIPKETCNSFITNYIIPKDLDNLFYYSAPIDKYNELDVNKMDQYSWFNYNNVCNKFVIAQLDSDFKDIQIAKSSRVSRW